MPENGEEIKIQGLIFWPIAPAPGVGKNKLFKKQGRNETEDDKEKPQISLLLEDLAYFSLFSFHLK